MKTTRLLLVLIAMLVLVAVWWIMTGRAPVIRNSEPKLASRGDALVNRLDGRLGTLWQPELLAPDLKKPEDLQVIVRYGVKDGLLQPQAGTRISPTHQRAWSSVNKLLPPELTRNIQTFILATDGRNGDRGWIQPTNDYGWQLALDPRDSAPLVRLNTLVYQSAYLLALDQVHIQPLPAGDLCATVMTRAGCVQKDSVMNRYVRTFWPDAMLKDWRKRKISEQPAQAEAFFAAYPKTFINEAAARSPEQDFAVSWTAFVLGPRPEREDTVAERKVAFFYSDPELTALRLKMLRRVSSAFPAK